MLTNAVKRTADAIQMQTVSTQTEASAASASMVIMEMDFSATVKHPDIHLQYNHYLW